MTDEKNYWLAFSTVNGIGTVKFNLLLNYFGSVKKAWESGNAGLRTVLGEKLADKFDRTRNSLSLEGYLDILKAKSIDFLILTDPF